MSNKLIKISVILFTGLVALSCWKRSAELATDEEDSGDEGDDNDSSSVSNPNKLTIENLEKKLLSDNRFDYDSCFTEEVAKFMGYIDLTSDGKICISINHEEYEEPSITVAESVRYMREVTYKIKDDKDENKFNIHVSHIGINDDGVAHKKFDENEDRDALTNIVVNKGTIDDVADLLYILMYPKDVLPMSNGYYRSKKGKLMIPVEYFPLRLVKKS